LQAIFDYQSLIAALTGMDVSNASHYDGATAVADGCHHGLRPFRGKRARVVLSPALHPHYRQTVRAYSQDGDLVIFGDETASENPQKIQAAAPEALIPLIDEHTALVIVQYPDFFGRIYDLSACAGNSRGGGVGWPWRSTRRARVCT
jgi:glycine dehydrogenase subunit 1